MIQDQLNQLKPLLNQFPLQRRLQIIEEMRRQNTLAMATRSIQDDPKKSRYEFLLGSFGWIHTSQGAIYWSNYSEKVKRYDEN